ncbi:MAG: hypothetical protein A2158_01320 [Chloroflexi bacterium RBG_13_46_14]|nr:MAG: hypothetical protein A2158_01320 [Chloroflexi bacterium RBG_13_46_14]
MPDEKKKVVYLLGAGASHAVIMHRDRANEGILMPDIAEDVLLECESHYDISLRDLCNIPWEDEIKKYKNVDIESIITLYETSGTLIDKLRTNILRNLFRKALITRLKNGLRGGNGSPTMLSAFFEMHLLPDFKEELSAVLTLNYDNLVEKAMFENYGSLNIPFEAIPQNGQNVGDTRVPVLCKLHGSFHWENTNPVRINDNLLIIDDDGGDNNDIEDRILWVPPGVIKRNDHYPFNAIWGAARYYLKCDILRIVGCSLNKNDWGILSLLHTTNRLRQDNQQYEIQLIDYWEQYKEINNSFPYLQIHSIFEDEEFMTYITAEYSNEWRAKEKDNDSDKIKAWLVPPENVFELWLKSKAYSLISTPGGISLPENFYLEKFYKGDLYG